MLKRKLRRSLTLVLSFSLAMSLSLSSAANKQAAIIAQSSDNLSLQEAETLSPYENQIIPENIITLAEIQSESTKVLKSDNLYELTTENADGSGIAQVFTVPVKYKDSKGDIKFIDTSMVTVSNTKNSPTAYTYQNAANSFQVRYAARSEAGFQMNQDFTLEFNTETGSVNGNLMSGEDGEDLIRYSRALGDNTYAELSNTNTGVKQTIVLEEKPLSNQFSFTFTSKTHNPTVEPDTGAIVISQNEKPEETLYILYPFYAYDSYTKVAHEDSSSDFRHFNEESRYSVTKTTEDVYTISVTVPEAFLNSPETVYPITLTSSLADTVNAPNSTSYVDDTYVLESAPSSKFYSQNYLRFGYDNGRIYSFVKFKYMPSIPADCSITSAHFIVTFRSGQTTSSLGACYEASSSMDVTNISWDYKPGINATRKATSDHNSCKEYDFVMTNSVKDWYKGLANHGFRFGYNNETYRDYNSVVSSEGEAHRAPKLVIHYAPYNGPTPGIESGASYVIENFNSGKVMDVSARETNVCQFSYFTGTNQQWKVQYEGGGYYSIAPVFKRNYRLDLFENSDTENSNIQIFPSFGGDSQRFRIIETYPNFYRIVPKGSTTRAVSLSGDNVVIKDYGQAYQTNYASWKFRKIYTYDHATGEVLQGSPVDNSGYNRTQAAAYANQYGENANSAYRKLGEDCTNFISQCLYAGGMSMIGKPLTSTEANDRARRTNVSNWYYASSYVNIVSDTGISHTWSLASNSMYHWGYRNGEIGRGFEFVNFSTSEDVKSDYQALLQNLKPGDLLYQRAKGVTGSNHAAIITRVESYEIYYAEHSGSSPTATNIPLSSTLNRYLGDNVSGWAFVRIRWN